MVSNAFKPIGFGAFALIRTIASLAMGLGLLSLGGWIGHHFVDQFVRLAICLSTVLIVSLGRADSKKTTSWIILAIGLALVASFPTESVFAGDVPAMLSQSGWGLVLLAAGLAIYGHLVVVFRGRQSLDLGRP